MDTQKNLLLFIDGSVNTKAKVGYGAYLEVWDKDLSPDIPKSSIKVKRFKNTSSTQLELQTLLWALDEIETVSDKVIVYTDSQNIFNLQGRRERLEKNDFKSMNNQPLHHHELYRQFYKMMDHLDCDIVKVKGHQPTIHKGAIERLFTLVDRASRKAMKAEGLSW